VLNNVQTKRKKSPKKYLKKKDIRGGGIPGHTLGKEKGGWDIKRSKGRFLLLVGPRTGIKLTERFSFLIVQVGKYVPVGVNIWIFISYIGTLWRLMRRRFIHTIFRLVFAWYFVG
jgi:hypothetical protein